MWSIEMKTVRAIITLFVLIVASMTSKASSLSVKSFSVGGRVGVVHAVFSKSQGDVLLGQPFVIELRPSCGQLNKTIRELAPGSRKSVCQVYPETMTLSADKQTLSVQVQEVNYDYQTEFAVKYPGVPTRSRCLPQKTVLEFDLNKLCRD